MKKIALLLIGIIIAIASHGQVNGNFKSIRLINSDSTHGTIDGTMYKASDGLLRFMWNGVHYRFLTVATAFGTAREIPFMNSGATNFTYSTGTFEWNDARRTLLGGASLTFSTPSNGYSIAVGQSMNVSGDWSWSALFGDVHTISASFNNNLLSGTGHSITTSPVFNTDISGESHSLTGNGWKGRDIIGGSGLTYNVTTTGLGNASGYNLAYGHFNTISGTIVRWGHVGGRLGQISADGAFVHGYPISLQSTRPILASGVHAINMSANSSSQTSGHGALANYSGIFAGQDANVPSDATHSVVIGGNGLKARSAETSQVYVPSLNILTAPTNNDTINQILVRDFTTGQIKYRRLSAFGTGNLNGSLTATRVPFASDATTLVDDADMTFTGGNRLNITNITSSGNVTASGTVNLTNITNDDTETRILTVNSSSGAIEYRNFNSLNTFTKFETVIPAATFRVCPTTPVNLIAAPGTGMYINIIKVIFSNSSGSTGYDFGTGNIEVMIGSTIFYATTYLNINTNSTWAIEFHLNPGADFIEINSPVTVTSSGSTDATTGDRDVKVTIIYTVESI